MTSADKNLDILILLPWEESRRYKYERLIGEARPNLRIHTAATLDEAAALIEKTEIFMGFGAAIHRDIFGPAKRLRWVHALGTGLDGITDQPGLGKDVCVTATRDIHGAPLSEITILFMLSLARNFPRSVLSQRRKEWDRFRAELLFGKTVGIIGVGKIAEDLAPRLKALGMNVVGVTRTPRNLSGFDKMESRDRLHAVVRDFDFVVLLVPLEAETRQLVDETFLAAMKPSAFLVNVARGALVDESALVVALQQGRIAGAALDTTEKEPLPSDSQLWEAPNLILTPHLGGFYEAYVDDSIGQLLFNLDCYISGRISEMRNREAR